MGTARDMLRHVRRRMEASKPFSLITVPAVISVALMIVAIVAVRVDELASSRDLALWPVAISYDTATDVLTAVAGGSITALSLAYSLVLVVFTLAAGNIGPRLLKRFTTDRVNQVTAGIFGGSFLFSLTTLYSTQPQFVPQLAVGLACLLAVLSVAQLIFFVHEVSRSVSIDDEIAEIAEGLERDIDALVADNAGSQGAPAEAPDFRHTLSAIKAGYIGDCDWIGLAALAEQNDIVIRFVKKRGSFLIEGEPMLEVTRAIDGEARDAMLAMVGIDDARSIRNNIEFSMHLLIEIALRALSPGVNDTFTAIACVDRLSSALAGPVKGGMREQAVRDDDDVVRVIVPGMAAADLIGVVFHPLRRAAGGNILMSQHLADAMVRLSHVARPNIHSVLVHHAELLLRQNAAASVQPEDLAFIRRRLSALVPEGEEARDE